MAQFVQAGATVLGGANSDGVYPHEGGYVKVLAVIADTQYITIADDGPTSASSAFSGVTRQPNGDLVFVREDGSELAVNDTINVPVDSFVNSGAYDGTTPGAEFIRFTNQDASTFDVPVAALVDIYTAKAAGGLAVNANEFEILKDPAAVTAGKQDILTLGAAGVKIEESITTAVSLASIANLAAAVDAFTGLKVSQNIFTYTDEAGAAQLVRSYGEVVIDTLASVTAPAIAAMAGYYSGKSGASIGPVFVADIAAGGVVSLTGIHVFS